MVMYQHKGVKYTHEGLKELYPNVSFPLKPSESDLEPFDVLIIPEVEKEEVIFDVVEPETISETEGLILLYTSLVQEHLDATARQRGYDDITTLATYKGSKIPKFNKEGTAGADWRDAVWDTCYTILDEIKAGTRTQPTIEQLIAELPVFTWGD